ncbi:MAG: 5'-methylthioadenosine/S-adenosylhomocysteine nucleosidase [Ahrensia sp.]|nr:5'-methylthioadenosine/S-adenosylhomocysteine nucleosidase [Ahrensia sp.]
MSSHPIKTVAGKRLLYVMAAQAEYGPHLQGRINPLICHVGPVEAGIRVARALAMESAVDLVVSLGSAGSATLEQAQVYQVSQVSYRDMDASPLGFEPGVTPFLDCPASISLICPLDDIPSATLATGASIVSGDAYAAIAADMVDMESYAITRACMEADVPMIGLRGISDGAYPLEELSDWTRYLEVIDERLAAVLDRLEAKLAADGAGPVENGQ